MTYSQLEPKLQQFPRRRFLGLAGFQVTVGLLFIVMGFVDLGVSLGEVDTCIKRGRGYDYDLFDDVMSDEDRSEGSPPMEMRPAEEIGDGFARPRCNITKFYASWACTPVICGIMFIIAGSLGLGAARTPVAHRKSGLKTGFMVMCVVNILGFIPMSMLAGGAEIVMNLMTPEFGYGLGSGDTFRVSAGAIYILLSLALMVVAIVSAGVACCCAPVEEVKVVYVPQYQVEQPSVATISKA